MYDSFQRTWRTLEGKTIGLSEIGDDHLDNIILMLNRNNRPVHHDLQSEQMIRKFKIYLAKSDEEIAVWLTSDNLVMRRMAQSAVKSRVDSKPLQGDDKEDHKP